MAMASSVAVRQSKGYWTKQSYSVTSSLLPYLVLTTLLHSMGEIWVKIPILICQVEVSIGSIWATEILQHSLDTPHLIS